MTASLASKRGSFNKHPDFNKKILVVDDEAAILQTLRYNLERSGYEVVTAGDGRSAIAMAQNEEPDLIVLDIMLPVLDGMEACKEIRKTSSVPIIMLTAKDQEIDKVLALELGADDYVTKPFALHEFLARVKARLRRPTPAKSDRDQAIVLGGIVLDPSRQHVTVRGKEVALAPKEFAQILWARAPLPCRGRSRAGETDRERFRLRRLPDRDPIWPASAGAGALLRAPEIRAAQTVW